MATPLSLCSPRTALVDRLREEQASAAVQVLGVVGFALLTALGAQARVYIWEVPFSLQTLAVYGSGLFLGWRTGALAQLCYLTAGLFLPVFAGDGHGTAYLFGAASGGYLLASPFAAAAAGALSRRWKTLPGSVLAMLAGSVVLFTGGVIGLHYAMGHASWSTSLMRGWVAFIPVDLAKILFVGLVYSGTRRFM